jgi:MoaA/NifB/PqqE/SkfB family radical SAM enzyme
MGYIELPNRIKFYTELIPELYSHEFPPGFRLMPDGYILPSEIINRPDVKAEIMGKGQMIRPLSTMDVEFAWNDLVQKAKDGKVDLVDNYPCGGNCPGCYNVDPVYRDIKNLMKWQEVVEQIDEARKIGLYSIKFLGLGDFFQNPDIFDILDAIAERNIKFGIFTKGAELGSDELAKQIHGKHGIRDNNVNSAQDLVTRLAEYDNVSILLGFNSFMPQIQDAFLGSFDRKTNYHINRTTYQFENRGITNYTEKRDQALQNLVEAGFNNPAKGQRLSLIAAPCMFEQITEMPDIYEWAAHRNIPVIIVPTMESGEKAQKLLKINTTKDPNHDKVVDLFVQIYSRGIDKGILTFDQLKNEGISPYIGMAPCNQIANGLYMRLNGQIQICPGRSDPESVYGNIHEKPLSEIWYNSPNYALGPIMNNWCPAKKEGLPKSVQERVLQKLSEKYS